MNPQTDPRPTPEQFTDPNDWMTDWRGYVDAMNLYADRVEAVTVDRIAAWLDAEATNPAVHPRDGYVLELTERDLYGIRLSAYNGIANAIRAGEYRTESPTEKGTP